MPKIQFFKNILSCVSWNLGNFWVIFCWFRAVNLVTVRSQVGYSSSRAPCISRLVEYSLSKVWLNQNWYRLLGFTKYTLFTITSGTFGHHPVLPQARTISGRPVSSSQTLLTVSGTLGDIFRRRLLSVIIQWTPIQVMRVEDSRRIHFVVILIRTFLTKMPIFFIAESRLEIAIFGRF